MEVVTIQKARALAMMELDSLTNGGRVRINDCIPALVAKYDFQKFPTTPEEFDLADKGVHLESGKADGFLIDSLVIYSGAMFVDTIASTDDSKRILLGLFEWGRQELGLSYQPSLIRKWAYISDVVFHCDFPLLRRCSPPLENLARKTSGFMEDLFDGLRYDPYQVWIGHDPEKRKNPIASLFITHRTNTSPSENIFFSEAPLPTHLHLQFLEEFENDVRNASR
jgi:hypothetical protein